MELKGFIAAAAAAAVVLLLSSVVFCQQPYEDNLQLNCNAAINASTLGYSCNSTASSCSSFLLFRSSPPYQSPSQISTLLNSDATAISAANNAANSSVIFPPYTPLIVPVSCSCSGEHYFHNATYSIKVLGENFFTVANNTFQGLSTCQAITAANPNLDTRDLIVGDQLVVPVRCACPSASEIAGGFKYLFTYLVTWGNDIPTIAETFNASPEAIWAANELQRTSTIFPFTTLLIPLQSEPVRPIVGAPPPSPPPPPPPPPTTQSGGGSDNKWVFVGIGIALGFLILAAAVFLAWWRFSPRRRLAAVPPPAAGGESYEASSTEYAGLSEKSSAAAWTLDSVQIRNAIESLNIYKFSDLAKATNSFDNDHKIRGSVFKGVINGDTAAIKRLQGDVSSEINILKNVNHSSVVRLSGFCLHQGDTFLVYEFAAKGSLADWIHSGGDRSPAALTWKQRVQVAYDVADGLNYLHNYANPPYVHKDLKSSNILLDGEFRGKIANFGLARAVEDRDDQLHLTRHVVGTQGYMAPEYLEHGLVTPKLDVFSYGVVLLELLSGKEPIASSAISLKNGGGLKHSSGTFLSEFAKQTLAGPDARVNLKSFMDPNLKDDYPPDLAFAMAQIAVNCVADEPNSRRAMAEVLISILAVFNATSDWADSSELEKSRSVVHGR